MIEGIVAGLAGLFVNAAVFVGVLTLVIFVHELGHFLVARWCGVTVTTFSIGFGKEIWGGYDRHGTRWRVAAVPLGGYVKFMDDENAASVPSRAALERLGRDPRPGSFRDKPVWQRAAVVAAGPLANFILAALIYTVVNAVVGVRTVSARIDAIVPGMPAAEAGLKPGDLITSIDGWAIESLDDVARAVGTSGGRTLEIGVDRGGSRLTFEVAPVVREQKDLGMTLRVGDIGIRREIAPRIGEVVSDMPAARAGFEPGDLVTAIDAKPIKSFEEIVEIVGESPDKELKFVVERGGRSLEIRVTPIKAQQKDGKGSLVWRGRIGVTPEPPAPQAVSFADALRLGIRETVGVISQTMGGITDMFMRRQSFDQVGGPIMMAEVTARVLDHGAEWVFRLAAFFSANIGLLNLLPIPVLDGGHLLFYGIEAARRRPLSPRAQEIGFQIGLALVLTLMVFATYNDIVRVGKRWLFGGG
ncbi:MAG TPA: RIP metalloprotease RseP [Hyphomicrobiaceae bacterium]|nr:RIP metalloprotease RseP [Hyphomicrobiaceae bacterium]